MPLRILPKDEQTKSESKWISKKEKPKSWITKKEKPAKKTNWIVKKQPKTNWITKKEAKEHDTTSARKWITKKKPVRSPHQGGGRTNLLEELGRVEGEPSNRNRRAEISRVHGELNRGYKHGKRVKKAIGGVAKIGKEGIKRFLKFIKTGKDIDKHGTKINIDKVVKRLKKQGSPGIETYFESTGKHPKAKGKAAGGRIGLKHGGSAGAAKRGHGAEIK
jgi:hypothetical protein